MENMFESPLRDGKLTLVVKSMFVVFLRAKCCDWTLLFFECPEAFIFPVCFPDTTRLNVLGRNLVLPK